MRFFVKSIKVNTFLRGILIFMLLTAMEWLLPAATAMIPHQKLQKHMEESASYYMKQPVFYRIHTSDPASTIDHYADSILLNILYYFDEDAPFSSVLSDSYYYTDTHNENENLMTAVMTNEAPTYDYSRYWHGSAIILRPLLLIASVSDIYLLLAVILGILTIFTILSLYRHVHPASAPAFGIAMILVSFWYIPMSFEYIWCFLLMFIFLLYLIHRYPTGRMHTCLFFFVIGNITAYFDFLTTETLTLLMPLAVLLLLINRDHPLSDKKEGLHILFIHTLLWGAGYLSSWLAKWSLASVVLHQNVFVSAFSDASVRLSGSTSELSGISLRFSAVAKNMSCLFPFNLISRHGYILVLICLITIGIFYYLFKKEKQNNCLSCLFLLLFFLPYARYLVLANHSYLHAFFTYRAQFASVFLLIMILISGLNWSRRKKH